MAGHDHSHDDHAHHHHAPPSSTRTLLIAVGLTGGFAGVEAITGWLAGSLALLGDAGHMVSDALALGLAAAAARIARLPAGRRHSWGLGRVEVLTGLINGLFMLAIVTGISVEAVRRLLDPGEVAGGPVMAVAALGLVVNLVVFWVLSRGEGGINVRGALLHVLGDLLGSVAALISGAVILATGWTPVDPLLSLLIAAVVLRASLALMREALHVVLEGVPAHLDLEEVGRDLAADPEVASLHDLHIWQAGSEMVALSAHVVLRDPASWPGVLERLQARLADHWGITHATLQPEVPPAFPLQRMGDGTDADPDPAQASPSGG
ncbi:MAG: cation diffusion facilitator family transporter [Pseudomonadota bacterium]